SLSRPLSSSRLPRPPRSPFFPYTTLFRSRCITALGAIGPAAQEAAPLLLSWLKTAKSDEVRGQIIEALGQMEAQEAVKVLGPLVDRKSTRLNSSHGSISYAVFCLKKKKKK